VKPGVEGEKWTSRALQHGTREKQPKGGGEHGDEAGGEGAGTVKERLTK